ncbi:MAG: hypothetical protein J5835_05785 [Bacteroidales bacterium]|nr:hypothetical protein [Bacteroidales bacterium]
MKRLIGIIFLALATTAGFSQVKSYTDNQTDTFIIGLDSYFYGENGSLGFSVKGLDVRAAIAGDEVLVCGEVLEKGDGAVIIGTHDFTGDRQVELVVARRDDNTIAANIYQYTGGAWKVIGRIGAADEGAREIRVFRQAFTIRNKRTNALYTWTYHAPKFDFKSSDGCDDPTP